MKRLYLIVLMVLGIALGSMAQTDALVVEQNNGLADILKVSANLRIENNTDGTISVKDGNNIVATYARADIKRIAFNDEKALTDSVERAALIALYNATDGANWTNNTNWCSDKPLSEWHGITTNEGHVTRISVERNNLRGTIPAEFGNLTKLTHLSLGYNSLSGEIPAELGKLHELKYLGLYYNELTGTIPDALKNLSKLENLSVTQNFLTGSIPKWIGNFEQLRTLNLNLNNFSGVIPSELGKLSELEYLSLGGTYQLNIRLTGEIPKSFGELKKLNHLEIVNTELKGSLPAGLGNLSELTYLQIAGNKFSGEIPAELGNLSKLRILYLNGNKFSGKIPAELGNLTKLTKLDLSSNSLSGEIPESFSNLTKLIEFNSYYGSNIFKISTYGNLLSGKIPSLFYNSPEWYHEWIWLLHMNNCSLYSAYNLDDINIPAPPFHVKDIDGNVLDSKDIYSKNKYTAIFHYTTFDPFSKEYIPEVVLLYEKYKDYGLEIIGQLKDENEQTIKNFVSAQRITWKNVLLTEDNMFDYPSSFNSKPSAYPENSTPQISLVDNTSRVVFTTAVQSRDELADFLKERLGEGKPVEVYSSTDFSADGNVKTLQNATVNNSIKVVIMGDGFSDRQIANGSYDEAMKRAKDALFSVEPMKNYRNMFTVKSVTAVSENEFIKKSGKTAFSAAFGNGAFIGGDNSKVFEYAKKAISEEEIDNAIIIVILNSGKWAGTCYMYEPENKNAWSGGAVIAYVPNVMKDGVSLDYQSFETLLNHEAIGHGFAKLGDEYVEKERSIPVEEIESYKASEQYGWWKNVDYTSNPASVKWNSFISDSRYAYEHLGVYEGALTYRTGAYRPSIISIMSCDDTDFNAPSRQAIWYRINKLTQGANWEGTYEDFVQFDKATASSRTANRARAKTENMSEPIRLAPPVVKNITWRMEK